MNHNARGHSYRESGQYDKAIAEFRKAIKLDPTDASASTQCVKIFETTFLNSTEIHGGPLSC